jgi:glucose-6-phosphate dehydrogenase assembly protein OpcA
VASGLALTLIAVTDEPRVRAVEDAATIAAAEHPCRLLIVVRDPAGGRLDEPSRLDAEIIVGGRLGPCEAVVLRMSGRLALHAESVVMPLLAPDVPVVTWWHTDPPDRIAFDPLGVVAERRITDVAECVHPVQALRMRADDYAPGDTDLAWTRITPWRTLIAGSFDTVDRPVVSARVVAPLNDPGAELLGGWLQARLGISPERVDADAPGIGTVTFTLDNGAELTLIRQDGTALLRRTGYADRILSLVHRRLGDELAEELRRLDADQPYAAALSAASGVPALNRRPPNRVHIWQDPALSEPPA